MEYLIFIGIVLVIIYGYHFIRYIIGDYMDLPYYMEKEMGNFPFELNYLFMVVFIDLLIIGIVYLGGCVIRYLFM